MPRYTYYIYANITCSCFVYALENWEESNYEKNLIYILINPILHIKVMLIKINVV
jgi:hypothetical protein